MLRLFVALNLLVLSLFACKGGYDSCVKKIKDSNSVHSNFVWIPVKNNKRLVYSECVPEGKILKHDPFLSLYLIKDTGNFPYMYDVQNLLHKSVAVVNAKKAIEGKIIQNQIGLNSLAQFSQKYEGLGILSNNCCSLEGIATPKGIIQKEYIQRFLSSASADYGDIGIRVKQDKKSVVVDLSSSNVANNPLHKGDIILELNGEKVKTASWFMKQILFSKIGSKHKIKIKRGSKILSLHVISQKRYGGDRGCDAILEFKGISFDKSLKITKLTEEFKKYGLKVGDKLIQASGNFIKTQEELLRYMEKNKDFSSLLFERDNFQFFVNIK